MKSKNLVKLAFNRDLNMRKANGFSLACLLLSAPILSHGADWWLVSASLERVTFIDMESIRDDDYGFKRSWVQFIEKDGTSSKVLAIYKCKEEEYGTKAIYSYKADGSTDGNKTNEYVSYNPVAPETIGYELLNISCAAEPEAQLGGELQGRLKEGVSPSELADGFFKASKSEKTTPPKKGSRKPQG